MSPAAARGLTIAAAVVLGFDGAALVGIGAWSGRAMLMLVGLILLAVAAGVLYSWRWYRRRLEDIAVARRALRKDALDLQRVLRDREP
jgi:hypothetical protein